MRLIAFFRLAALAALLLHPSAAAAQGVDDPSEPTELLTSDPRPTNDGEVRVALRADESAVIVAGQGTAEAAEEDSDEWRRRRPRIDGYLQVFYKHSVETGSDGFNDNPLFRVQRVRLGIEGSVMPRIFYDVEFDPRAPEISGVLRDAFIDFRVIPDHRLLLGQQKTRFGWENNQSSTRHFFVNRTEIADNLMRGTNLRDVGIGLVGHVELNSRWRFEDALTLVNGDGLNVQDNQTPMQNFWGRIGLRYRSDGLTLHAGVSGAVGDVFEAGEPLLEDAHTFDIWRAGADVRVEHDWLFAAAEFAYGQDDIPALTLPEPTDAETETVYGFSAQLALLTPLHVGPTFRIDTVTDEYRRYTFGAYYGERSDRFRMVLNYELRSVMDGARGDDKIYLWTQVRF